MRPFTQYVFCQVSLRKKELFLRQEILFFIHTGSTGTPGKGPFYTERAQKWQSFLWKSIKVKYRLIDYPVRIHLQLTALSQCKSKINPVV